MGELGVLFNPGMRHEQEEKLAKQMLREDEGTGRKGRRGIDLDSGVVVIGADDVPLAEPPESNASVQADPDAESESAESESSVDGASKAATNGGDSSSSSGGHIDGADVHATAVHVAGAQGSASADRRAQPTAAPGTPRQARVASSAVPRGKARRRDGGIPSPSAPVSKAHRGGR